MIIQCPSCSLDWLSVPAESFHVWFKLQTTFLSSDVLKSSLLELISRYTFEVLIICFLTLPKNTNFTSPSWAVCTEYASGDSIKRNLVCKVINARTPLKFINPTLIGSLPIFPLKRFFFGFFWFFFFFFGFLAIFQRYFSTHANSRELTPSRHNPWPQKHCTTSCTLTSGYPKYNSELTLDGTTGTQRNQEPLLPGLYFRLHICTANYLYHSVMCLLVANTYRFGTIMYHLNYIIWKGKIKQKEQFIAQI